MAKEAREKICYQREWIDELGKEWSNHWCGRWPCMDVRRGPV